MTQGFEVVEIQSGLWKISDPGYSRPSHSYLVSGSERAALIDSGCGLRNIREIVGDLTDLEIVVLQSHAHPDHAGGSHFFDSVFVHPRGVEKLKHGWSNLELRFTLERYLKSEDVPENVTSETFSIPGCESVEALEDRGVVDLGDRQLDVFFTPGHSDDSLCFLDLEGELLFTGDSVLKGQIAVENSLAYRRSLQDLVQLAGLAQQIFPGHGPSPIEPAFVTRLRQGFTDAVADRRPSGFLAGFATFDFDDFGIMLPPRRRRVQDQ